jgi:hypothetical protein
VRQSVAGLMTIKEWAQLYLDHGWEVVPLAPGTKRVTHTGWMQLKFHADDFDPSDNIGLRSTHGLVFVDVDCPEAVAFSDAFLPETTCIYGRPSKPRSKRIYRSDFPKTLAFKDRDDRSTLIEIRSQHQDMAPPSQHPGGETLTWDGENLGTPATVPAEDLTRAVKLVATAAVIARHYNPSGSRHEWCLALAGTLRRRGLTEAECSTLITHAAEWAHDGKLNDRLTEIHTTFAHDADDPFTGATALEGLSSGALASTLTTLWGEPAHPTAYVLNTRNVPDRNNIGNISLALDKLKVTLRYDTFAKKPFIVYNEFSGLLDDDVCTDLWLDVDRHERFRPTKDLFFDVLKSRAREISYHPVRDYLLALTWDGVPRLDSWLITCANAPDTLYTRAISAIVLVAAVRRVLQPGCKFDEMLVLESGEQGLLKSTALRTLCPDPLWFSDDLPLNVPSKEIIERTAGKWIVEASDLSGMRSSQVEHLKGLLSRQVDGPVRMAYARLPVEAPRQFVLIGTTNSYTYLSDQTGNRRFWPLRVDRFDIPWIQQHRDQLWAEAVQQESQQVSIRLDPSLYALAAEQQQKRVYDHPWAESLSEEYKDKEMGIRLTPEEIWTFLAVPVERRTAAGSRIIAQAMQAIGYRRISVRSDAGTVVKGWGRDDTD